MSLAEEGNRPQYGSFLPTLPRATMAYSEDQLWAVFLELLKSSADPDSRDAWRQIQHRLVMDLDPERTVRRDVEAGHLGPWPQQLWRNVGKAGK